jgi:hypothetical protein
MITRQLPRTRLLLLGAQIQREDGDDLVLSVHTCLSAYIHCITSFHNHFESPSPKKRTITSILVAWLVGYRINHLQLEHASQSVLALSVGDAFLMWPKSNWTADSGHAPASKFVDPFVELSTPIGPMSHMMQSHLQEVPSFQ